MKSIFSILFASLTFFASAQVVDVAVDLDQSSVTWTGKKVTKEHTGNIQLLEGSLKVEEGILIGGEFVIDMESITCTDLDEEYGQKLVSHLQSEDFFDVASFPEATLVLDKVERIEGYSYHVKGLLTIKGNENPIEFYVDFKENEASTLLKVNRAKYDVRYGSTSFFDQLGDKAISDIFELEVNLVY